MIARCRERIAAEQLGDRVEAQLLRIEDLRSLGTERFDGLVSAFASLNSLPDLLGLADDTARLVRPGGRMILHMLNRFSQWEWLGYLARHDLPAARRVGRDDTRQFVIGGVSVRHRVYHWREAVEPFAHGAFQVRGCYGLGALRPPHTVTRIPRLLVSALEWLDLRVGGWPAVRDRGRFFVLDLERRSA
jgi:SAM-dependent methyltransferase